MPRAEVSEQVHGDLRQVLDEELARLPDRYREIVVLCELQGEARKDVSRLLGCPEGTVASRLARARALLAARLTRRGLAFSSGSIAAMVAQNSASGGVPPTLVSATVKAASLLAAGQGATATLISAEVISLSEKVVKAVILTKLKTAVALMLMVGAFGSGAGWLYYHGATAAQPEPGRISTPPADAQADQMRKDIVRLKYQLLEAMDKIAVLEDKLAAKAPVQTEVLFKGKPASYWIKQLQDRSLDYRIEAVAALGGIGEVDRSVIPVLVKSLQDKDSRVCEEALRAVLGVGKQAIPSLIAALQNSDLSRRTYIIRALAGFGDTKAAVPELIPLLKSPNRADRLAAAQALGHFPSEADVIIPALMPLLKKTTETDSYMAAKAIGQIGPQAKQAVPALIQLLAARKPVPIYAEDLGMVPSSGGRFGAEPNPAGGGGFPNYGRAGRRGGSPGIAAYWSPAKAAANALGKIGPQAKEAVPALLEVLKNLPAQNQFNGPFPADYPIGLEAAATNAIRDIDPMALPQVPGGGGRGGRGGPGGGDN
jgi:Sigma-70, region 4/HEAT repeats/PBS lyase HEAT-like repeat